MKFFSSSFVASPRLAPLSSFFGALFLELRRVQKVRKKSRKRKPQCPIEPFLADGRSERARQEREAVFTRSEQLLWVAGS